MSANAPGYLGCIRGLGSCISRVRESADAGGAPLLLECFLQALWRSAGAPSLELRLEGSHAIGIRANDPAEEGLRLP
jgi:hypothetical protein